MTAAVAVSWPTVAALVRRSANELVRVPGAAIPGVLAPTIFFLGLTSVFGNLTELRGFDTDSYQSFLIPVSMLQGAGFTGAATGVNLARDIEQGWFDRLLASPAPRPAILGGLVASAGWLLPGAAVGVATLTPSLLAMTSWLCSRMSNRRCVFSLSHVELAPDGAIQLKMGSSDASRRGSCST